MALKTVVAPSVGYFGGFLLPNKSLSLLALWTTPAVSCLETLWEIVEYYMLFLPWDLQGNSGLSFQLVVPSLSRVWLFVTPLTAAQQAPLSFTMSPSLLKVMSIDSVMLSNYLVLCCPLLLLPSIFSSIRVFSNKSSLHIKWPMY